MSSVESSQDLSSRDREALALIQEHGGIHQSVFWKEMDVSSRTGSRIISKLQEQELVEREETVHKGRVTYYITPVRETKDLDFTLLMAGDMISPFIGEEQVDPQDDAFSHWIMNLVSEEREHQ